MNSPRPAFRPLSGDYCAFTSATHTARLPVARRGSFLPFLKLSALLVFAAFLYGACQ